MTRSNDCSRLQPRWLCASSREEFDYAADGVERPLCVSSRAVTTPVTPRAIRCDGRSAMRWKSPRRKQDERLREEGSFPVGLSCFSRVFGSRLVWPQPGWQSSRFSPPPRPRPIWHGICRRLSGAHRRRFPSCDSPWPETRQHCYAGNPGPIVEGGWSMGAAMFDEYGRPAWALGITEIESRFSTSRRPGLSWLLLEQAHVITKKLRNRSSGDGDVIRVARSRS